MGIFSINVVQGDIMLKWESPHQEKQPNTKSTQKYVTRGVHILGDIIMVM